MKKAKLQLQFVNKIGHNKLHFKSRNSAQLYNISIFSPKYILLVWRFITFNQGCQGRMATKFGKHIISLWCMKSSNRREKITFIP